MDQTRFLPYIWCHVIAVIAVNAGFAAHEEVSIADIIIPPDNSAEMILFDIYIPHSFLTIHPLIHVNFQHVFSNGFFIHHCHKILLLKTSALQNNAERRLN